MTKKIGLLFAIACAAVALSALAQNPLTHRNWHGIDEATVFAPFRASDYDTIAVENFEINGARLPPAKPETVRAVEAALNNMKPEFIAGLTKNARRPVSGQATGRTLVVRARLAKLVPGGEAGHLFEFESGTVQIQIIGELIDGPSGQLLVRFAQERQSGFKIFGGGHDELFRQTARQLGADVATLINAFAR